MIKAGSLKRLVSRQITGKINLGKTEKTDLPPLPLIRKLAQAS